MSRVRLGALGALALVALDVAAVPAALPSVRVELGSSTSGLVWVQGGYVLALAVTLLFLGSRRQTLEGPLATSAGLVAFAAGAVLAFTADSTALLVTGRMLQGAGAAPLILAALEVPRPADGRRGAAFVALVGALLVLALAPLVGGALAEKVDWRWLFRLELLPAALAVLLLGGPRRPAMAPAERRAGAVSAGLVCATIGLIQSRPWGWASADTLLFLAAGAGLLVVAGRAEPTADGRADLTAQGGGAALAVAGTLCVALLFAPQYLELVRGLSPLRSGLLTAALTLPVAVLGPLAASLTARRGALRTPLLALGPACAALGALGATRIDPASSYALVVLSLGLLGAGTGATAGATPRPPVISIAAGAALVVAAAGALFQRAQLEEREGGGSFEDALSAGLVGSAWLLAALLAAAALVAWLRRDRG
ncbi:MAG: MFS transporter [Thermoleophilaceae bacterium]